MDGVLKELKNIPFIGIILYAVIALFFVMNLFSMISHGYIEGLLFIIAAIVTIPLATNQLKKRMNTSIPGFMIFFLLFCLVVIAIAAFPAAPTAINNTNNAKVITAPLSEINGSTIAVPSKLTPTPASTPTPTTTPIEATKPTPTPIYTTKDQDSQWLTTCVSDMTQVDNDMKDLTIAGKNYATTSLSTYAGILHKVIKAPRSKINGSTIAVPSKLTPTPTPPTKTPIEATASTPTQIHETTKYQDSKWLTTCVSDTKQVDNDIKELTNAGKNYDTTSLSTYATILYTDSQKAIEDSDLCNVSPDLQGAKDEYQLAMAQASQVAVHANSGVEEYNNGNFEAINTDLEQAIECVKSYNEHDKKVVKLSNNYKSKKK